MTVFRSEAVSGGLHRLAASDSTGALVPGPLSLAGDLFLIMLDDATGQLAGWPSAWNATRVATITRSAGAFPSSDAPQAAIVCNHVRALSARAAISRR